MNQEVSKDSKKARATKGIGKSKSRSASKSKKSGDAQERDYVASATLRHVRVSPRKARLVLNLIKGKQVEPALQILKYSPKAIATMTTKLLNSAISNAKESASADVDRLWIVGGWVDMGRTLKRYMPRAQGRATPIKKRSAHITILLGER